jgi:putative transposase
MVGIAREGNAGRFFRNFVKKGRKSARELTRARILLLANQQKEDKEIAELLGVENTVWKIEKREKITG